MTLCLLSLASWLAVAPASGSGDLAEAYRRGEDVVWTIEVAGQKIGEHWLRYEGTADVLGQKAQRFTAFARLKASSVVGTVDQKFAAEMLLDERGRPLRHDLEVDVGGSYTRIELTFANAGATARVTQGNGTRDLEIKAPPDVHVLANNFIAYLELLFRTNPPAPDKPTSYQLLSANALQVFPYQVTRERELSEGDVQGTVFKDSLGESLSVASDGRLLRLEVASQKLVFRRSSEKPEPIAIERPKPQQNDRITSEEVTITHDAVKLAGAITRPKGSTGRLPGIFFISGSGAQDRQGYSSGIDLGTHEILDRLTEAGFCVLRVDDRGAGGSTGPLENITYDDLVSDALACVDFLFARSDVDPERVAVIGHSEGGLTAMIAAAQRERIAAIVTMAAAGRSIFEVLKEQKTTELDDAGITGAKRDEELAVHRKFLELMASDREVKPDEVRADYRSALPMRAWIKSHAKQDPIAAMKRVHCPVLVLQGEKDFQVSAERDAKPLAAALDAAHNEDHELKLFPDLDHLFKKVEGARSQLSDYAKQRPVDPEFLDVLVKWLSARLKPNGG